MKRFLSILLCSVMLVTAVPGTYYAQGFDNVTAYSDDGSNLNNEIDYQLNGGHYVSGYKAPDTYPAEKLPDKNDMINQGYEFGGWYDNAELTGNPVTEINEGAYSGVVVLYARWIERYYYIDIPESVNVVSDNAELSVGGRAGGLYEKDKISVSVSSANEWKLVNGSQKLGYGLFEQDSDKAVVNKTVISELTPTVSSKTGKYFVRLSDVPSYAGVYSDNLTFDIAFDTTKYNIKYVTNGGTLYSRTDKQSGVLLTEETLEAGTILSELPVPGKADGTFLGWCYDSSCTDYVNASDRLLSDVILYASWADTQELKTVSMDTYARSYDVNADDFSVTITDKSGKLTADEVKNYITVKNTSDLSDSALVNVSFKDVLDGMYTFTVESSSAWQEGSSYRLELNDDRLYFSGYDPAIREYDFTVYKQEVSNVELDRDIKYISSDGLTDLVVDGKAVDKISVSAMTIGVDGTITDSTKTTGSFTYKEADLKTGDKIAVYDGDVIPSLNKRAVSDDDVSFFEITAADGSKYTYRGLAAKEILFVPDVLPVNIKDDKDGNENNNSITIAQEKLTFNEEGAELNPALNEDTSIDNGDYLALYKDEDAETLQYAVIKEVSKTENDYIIVYDMVTWDDVQAAMDVYQTDNINGDAILKNQDVSAIEESVEQQAVNSGFAQSVADEVAKAVVRTDSYQELKSYLSDSLGADIDIMPVDGYSMDEAGLSDEYDDQIAVYAGSKPSVKLDHVNANLSTRLKHFENISGLRLALDIGVEIAFSNMKVVVSATFEQEVKLNINVSGKAIWKKWKKIIPYIDDYRVAVSLDLYDYTGIGLDVNVQTAEGDEEDEDSSKLDAAVNKISEELKNMMELGTTYISENSDISTRLEEISDLKKDTDSDDSDDDKEISVAKNLAERYTDLLKNEADWVDLYTKSLTSSHVRVIGIIDVAFDVEFVVSANVNISMGMTYWYQNAKRYVYSIMVFSKNVTSDTIDLSEERYELSVYAIGTIGIKAGIRLSVSVGLISTKLASVGFTSEVGGYAQIWGYLYYQLKYAASQGKTASSMGAVYLELGIYMQVDFLAQALAGTFSYNPTLFDKQWPLYSVGVIENVGDFANSQDTYKDVKLKRDIKRVRIPDTYFEMDYLDMKKGLSSNGEYFKKIYDDSDEYYVITITNPAFSYDPATNIISVNPGDEPEQDGEMIITWKSQKGSFNTKPITRRISLHWDNLRDGYYIAFQTNGGSMVDTVVAKYGKEVAKPEDPVKQGYIFAGWYSDAALTKKYEIPDTMPNEDRIVYAKWEAADMTYEVVDYVEGTDGIYNIGSTRTETAKTDETVSPVPDERNGFMTPSVLSQVVKADGSTKINYYYARNKYKIKFVSDGETVSEGAYTYGTRIQTPTVYKPGYVFAGWEPAVMQTVPATDTTYTAVWKEADDVTYSTRYYIEDENGDYVLERIKTGKGTTGQEVTAEAQDYGSRYVAAGDNPSGKITADGSLVLKAYYERNAYDITYETSGGKLDSYKQAAKWGTKVITQVPVRAGYAFMGWYTDKECTHAFDGSMPSENITLYAKWEQSQVNYTVEHLTEKTDGSGYDLYERKVYTADADSYVTPDVLNMTGFSSPDKLTVQVKKDGSTVIKYYYKRNIHKLILKLNNGDKDMVYEYRYGTKISVGQPVRKGYIFAGWDKELAQVMPDEDITYNAEWKALQFTISFKTDGGSAVEAITQEYGTVVSAPEIPVKKGYTFIGWDKDIPERMPAENMTFTAQWKKDVYNITYNLGGGEADNPANYEVDSKVITLKAPTRKGFAFTGWSGTGIDGISNEVVITTGSTGDRTYTANWKENSYTVQFIPYGDGTTGSMEPVTLKYTDSKVIENTFKRPGYTFAGWSLEVGGEKKYDAGAAVSGLAEADGERITLYPAWTANEYTVKFRAWPGNPVEAQVYTYDKEYELPSATSYNYKFLGWCLEDDGLVVYEPGAKVSNLAEEGTVILYAKLMPVTYSNYIYKINDIYSKKPATIECIIGGDSNNNSVSSDGRKNVCYMDKLNPDDIYQNCTKMKGYAIFSVKMKSSGIVILFVQYKKNGEWYSVDNSFKSDKLETDETKIYDLSWEIEDIKDVSAIRYTFKSMNLLGINKGRFDAEGINFSVKFE